MNGSALINKMIESFQPNYEEALKIWRDKGEVVVHFNGQRWQGLTLDIVLDEMKQSLAIKYLEEIAHTRKI